MSAKNLTQAFIVTSSKKNLVGDIDINFKIFGSVFADVETRVVCNGKLDSDIK